jgi:hypothetical protein
MPNLIELLHQAQKELTCPTCGRSFHLSEIRPRGHVNHTIMLQAVCSNNHFPIVLIFIPTKPFKTNLKPITKKDVLAISQAIESFEGTFNTLWKSKKTS